MNPETLPRQMIGCGVLRKEISFLIQKNRWPVEPLFLDSSLHVDFDRLAAALAVALDFCRPGGTLVCYGDCHPDIDSLLESRHARRMPARNCLEMLLGPDLYLKALSEGALFLLEDWTGGWEHSLTGLFGRNRAVLQDIMRQERSHLLCITTPCSGDFRTGAQSAGSLVGLPLRWHHASLDHLESLLETSLGDSRRHVP